MEGQSKKRYRLPGKGLPARLIALAMLLLLSGSLSGCSVQQPDPEDGRMKIVTTIFPQYDFARAIAGPDGLADITMLLSPGEEIHSYEPTPLDIRRIQECDLFI